MISFAITGGIGSGKSYVSALLEQRGIPIYNADNEAKRLMVTDEVIHRGLVSLLGEDVYQDGNLNKQLLAGYLFADPLHAARINAIVHPRVKADFYRWKEQQSDQPVVGMECAILFESGFDDTVDQIVMVYAPLELRVERAMQRDTATREQILARISAQMDDEEKRRKSDFVILNDGSKPLGEQLDKVLTALQQGNKSK